MTQAAAPGPQTPGPTDPADPERPAASRYLAVGLAVVATALVAATSVIAKALGTGVRGEELHALQISAGRFGFGLAVLLPYLALRWPGTANMRMGLFIGRTICGWSGGTFLFAAAARMGLGDANAIGFLAPVITMVLSIFFLGERVSGRRWAAATLSMVGAITLSAPGTSAFQPAAILALASALLVGAELAFIKRLTDIDSPLRILAMSNGLGAVVAVPVGLWFWISPSPTQWLLLALLGAMMVSGQVMFIQANRRGDASLVAPIFYTASLFAALYDFVLFDVSLSNNSAIGIGLILIGAIALATTGQKESVDDPPGGSYQRGPTGGPVGGARF